MRLITSAMWVSAAFQNRYGLSRLHVSTYLHQGHAKVTMNVLILISVDMRQLMKLLVEAGPAWNIFHNQSGHPLDTSIINHLLQFRIKWRLENIANLGLLLPMQVINLVNARILHMLRLILIISQTALLSTHHTLAHYLLM